MHTYVPHPILAIPALTTNEPSIVEIGLSPISSAAVLIDETTQERRMQLRYSPRASCDDATKPPIEELSSSEVGVCAASRQLEALFGFLAKLFGISY